MGTTQEPDYGNYKEEVAQKNRPNDEDQTTKDHPAFVQMVVRIYQERVGRQQNHDHLPDQSW